ncbi:outer membrane beta-barrel protein [Spirosoma soli]|uniref:Outer membrane beta-barrel protein n=1 Tax=Spirosoma soli TaxID=1770529 RepID=A0ABW5M136_9BACT
MRSFCSFLLLSLLPVGLSVAQTSTPTSSTGPSKPATTSRPAVKPPATRPAVTDNQGGASTNATPTPSTSSNRQQELYDQYHGINKKTTATTAPATAEKQAVSRPASRIESSPTPAPSARTETASPPAQSAPSSPAGSSESNVRIGLRGGVTYLVFTEQRAGADPTVGFVGGITFNFGKGTLSFQPEINYARYSTKASILGLSITAASDLVEVPLFLKISSGTYEGNRFFLNVGPYATYIAGVSVDGKKESLDDSNTRFGFGAAAGIGAAIKAGPGHFTVEVRGHYPLGDIENGFSTDVNTIFSQATLGYIFPLGGR